MKKLLTILLVLLAAYSGFKSCGPLVGIGGRIGESEQAIASAFRYHRSGIQVSGQGVVEKILPDDNDGSRHQKFVVKLPSGQTLLIAHNIDLAPRVYPLARGDSVAFRGVYEWNAQGGVVHWTHRDPRGSHESGWLRRNGRTFQ